MAELNNKEQNNVDNRVEHENSLTFDEKVIRKIAGFAAGEIPGILAISGNLIAGLTDKFKNLDDSAKGITVELGKKQVAVDMKVICEYGQNMPNIFQSIVDKVSSAIKEMTGLEVVEVNVHVFDVLTKEDFERRKKVDMKSDTEVLPPADTDAPPSRVD